MKNVLRKSLLIVLASLMAACAAATPAPTPTVVPTEPPTVTATLVPPTATATPVPTATATATPVPPTATPLPPTDTPEPTATPQPTKTATPKPTQAVTVTPRATALPKPATSAPANSTSSVSSAPSTLLKSISEAKQVVQDLIGVVDQMLNNKQAVELCTPAKAMLESILAAPAYDVGGQSASAQQAYALYRESVEIVNSTATTMRSCGGGGSTVKGSELGLIRRKLGSAVTVLGRAVELARPAANQLPAGTLLEAVERTRQAVASLGAALDRATGSGNPETCDPVLADFGALEQAPVFEVGAQPSNVQTAYAVYRQAVSDVLSKADSMASLCRHGGGSLSANDYARTRLALKTAEGMLINALSMLQQ